MASIHGAAGATAPAIPTSGRLLLLRLLLQRLSDGITNEQTAGLAHGLHGVVIAGIEAHGQWALTQRLLPIRDAVLMLPEVFYRSHALTRLHAIKANGGATEHQRYRETLASSSRMTALPPGSDQ